MGSVTRSCPWSCRHSTRRAFCRVSSPACAFLDGIREPYEVVAVDDGSTDGTLIAMPESLR